MSEGPKDKPEVATMSDQKDDDTGPAGKVVPVDEVAAEIVRMFDEAAAKEARGSEPSEPPAEPVAVRLMTEAWERAIDVRDADARLFPDHRGLEPGEGSGRA